LELERFFVLATASAHSFAMASTFIDCTSVAGLASNIG
jgi:hypothetical protein